MISRKFAAAALFNGFPVGAERLAAVAGECPARREARLVEASKTPGYRNVAVPIWLGHADTDPVVTRAGSRVPFAILTGQGTVASSGELVTPSAMLRSATPLVRYYEATNRAHGSEVRYTEYQYGSGDDFRDLGMVKRNGHFS